MTEPDPNNLDTRDDWLTEAKARTRLGDDLFTSARDSGDLIGYRWNGTDVLAYQLMDVDAVLRAHGEPA